MARLLATLLASTMVLQVVAENGQTAINLNDMNTMFNFGDSYSTTGYVPKKGKVKELKGMGETTSGGYNWVQFLAYSQPKLATSYYDFARSGATVNNSVVPSNAQSFVDQFKLWKEWFVGNESEVKWASESTLFTIWFGINDVGYMTELNLNGTRQEPLIFDTYTKLVNELYDLGARNILFLNVPPTHKTPYVKTKSAKDIATFETLIASYNHRLFSFVTNLVDLHPEMKVALFDTQSFFTTILDSPQQYGFKQSTNFCDQYTWSSNNPNNTQAACGGSLEQYVWYNPYHPSWAVHRLMSLVIEDMLSPPERILISDPFDRTAFVPHNSALLGPFQLNWGALVFFLVIAVFAAQTVDWRQCADEVLGRKREEGYEYVESESV
ncbi:hypothetical protein JCM5353_006145 [Sporobolomyces roseus]